MALHAKTRATWNRSVGLQKNAAVICQRIFVAIGLRRSGKKRGGEHQEPGCETSNLRPAMHEHPRLPSVYSLGGRAEKKTEFVDGAHCLARAVGLASGFAGLQVRERLHQRRQNLGLCHWNIVRAQNRVHFWCKSSQAL